MTAFSDLRKRQRRMGLITPVVTVNDWHVHCPVLRGQEDAVQSTKIIDSQMKASFLKSLGIVSLSVLLLCSGVAWTLENCLEDSEADDRAGHNETSITTEPAVPSLAVSLNRDRHPFATIHCVVSHYQIGPMVQVSSGSSLTPSRDLLSKISLTGGSVMVGKTNSLWLHALFEWYARLSSSSGVSRHLFLSVFRI